MYDKESERKGETESKRMNDKESERKGETESKRMYDKESERKGETSRNVNKEQDRIVDKGHIENGRNRFIERN